MQQVTLDETLHHYMQGCLMLSLIHAWLILLWLVTEVHCDLLIVTLSEALNISCDLHIILAHCCLLWLNQCHQLLSCCDDFFILINSYFLEFHFRGCLPDIGLLLTFRSRNLDGKFTRKLALDKCF